MNSIITYLKMLIANQQALLEQINALNARVTKLEKSNTETLKQLSSITANVESLNTIYKVVDAALKR